MIEYIGVLTVKLIGGNSLAARDRSGKSDPYAVLTLGEQHVRSKVPPEHTRSPVGAHARPQTQMQTLQPVWNEKFQFCVGSFDDKLEIKVRPGPWGARRGSPEPSVASQVLDWDRIGKPEPMGDVLVKLDELEDNKPTYKCVTLEHVECGQLHIELTFTMLA